jgi:RND family efflux transporter MFP subunit
VSAIHQSIKIFHRTIVCGLVSVALTGCGKPAEAPVPAPAKSADAPKSSGPAVSVTTVIATQREFAVNLRAVGTVVPLVSVEVKPQLSAVVAKVHVQEGQFVRKGEALFSLDARNDEANVIRLQAQMARNEVALVDAQRQLARSRDLLARKFVAQGATDSSQAAVDSLSAAVAADRAALDAAKVALSYTRVVAPSAGRVGAINVFVGTSVQANQTTLLSITQLDPIEVAFSIPQLHVGDALAALSLAKDTVNVRTDTGEQFSGRVQFVDNAVDMATGTVKVKARLGNRESRLWPGAFVNVEFVASSLKAAVVVPAAAVVQSARGPIVYVVQDGKAVLRKIQLLEVQGEDAAVSGIAAGAKVVLDGKQNVRPDSVVVERTAADSAKPDADAKPGSPSS